MGSKEMDKMVLDFGSRTTDEILNEFQGLILPKWAQKVIDLIKQFQEQKEFCFKTSGTTGAPKEITFSKKQVKYSCQNTLGFFQLKKGDKVLLPLSVEYIAGKMMVFRAVEGGLKLTVIAPTSNPFLVLDEKEKFDFTPVVPLQIHEILNSEKESILRLGVLLVGGAEISQPLVTAIQSFKIKAWASFGMTETLTHFALKQLSPFEEKCFSCLKGYSAATDERSCLVVRNDDFIGELLSNDVVELKGEGKFVWKGRFDNVINSGGVKIHPEEIEAVLKLSLPKEVEFIVAGRSNHKLGDEVVLYYKKNVSATKELFLLGAKQLPKYQQPKKFICVDEFEKTNSGKIKRSKLV